VTKANGRIVREGWPVGGGGFSFRPSAAVMRSPRMGGSLFWVGVLATGQGPNCESQREGDGHRHTAHSQSATQATVQSICLLVQLCLASPSLVCLAWMDLLHGALVHHLACNGPIFFRVRGQSPRPFIIIKDHENIQFTAQSLSTANPAHARARTSLTTRALRPTVYQEKTALRLTVYQKKHQLTVKKMEH